MNTTAFEEGYKAYENYQHLSENPYFKNDNKMFNEWWDGYEEARGDNKHSRTLVGKWP